MILPYAEAKRFFKLFDLVTTYAHQRLGVVSDKEFYTGEPPRGIGEYAQRATAEELWHRPDIIDDFVRDNPADLSADLLEIVRSWRDAYMDTFLVTRVPDGELVFLAGFNTFAVCGLSVSLQKLLPQVPAVVHTTLLPYGDRIVYGMFLADLSVELGSDTVQMFEQSLTEGLEQQPVIRTGAELQAALPTIKHNKEERRLEEFRHDIEMAERAAGPLPGQHRGILAGMNEEDRECTIHERMKELDREEGYRPLAPTKILDEHCAEFELATTLPELLRREGFLDESLLDNDQDDADGLSYEEFEAAVVAELAHPGSLQYIVSRMRPSEVERLRTLAQNGGRMSFAKEAVTRVSDVPYPMFALCYLFDMGDHYESVMPEEVVEPFLSLDWDAAQRFYRRREELIRFFDLLVDLRGMERFGDALDEYCRTVPDAFDVDTAERELVDSMGLDDCTACMLSTEDEDYLLHYELLWEYRKEKGRDAQDGDSFEEGELDRMLKGLQRHQKDKEPRPITTQMLAEPSFMHWAGKLPAVRAMRDFLDAHVPDEVDDCFFADKVVDDLMNEAQWGPAPGMEFVNNFFDILDANGFVPDESQVQQLATLWSNFCNSFPIWPNRGWSPNEIHGHFVARSGRHVFYNEDGSVMKVGRNDPCPCGSGKKYKRCCGRP